MIDQTLWCVTYWADFAIWSLPAKYNRLNEQNLSSLKFWHLISFYKMALLEFCSMHDTLQSTRFTPLPEGGGGVHATPRSVSFRGLLQNFRRASSPLSYAESPPRDPSAVSAREGLYLRWILEHQFVGKVKFWDPKGVPTWGENKKRTKLFGIIIIIIIILFIYLFIYLFIFEAYVFALNLVETSLFLFPY